MYCRKTNLNWILCADIDNKRLRVLCFVISTNAYHTHHVRPCWTPCLVSRLKAAHVEISPCCIWESKSQGLLQPVRWGLLNCFACMQNSPQIQVWLLMNWTLFRLTHTLCWCFPGFRFFDWNRSNCCSLRWSDSVQFLVQDWRHECHNLLRPVFAHNPSRKGLQYRCGSCNQLLTCAGIDYIAPIQYIAGLTHMSHTCMTFKKHLPETLLIAVRSPPSCCRQRLKCASLHKVYDMRFPKNWCA